VDFSAVDIMSPKRARSALEGWQGFFPYYAGYPLSFAARIIASSNLPSEAVIMDPWNGSGTTTFAALEAGLASVGVDLNPAMVVVARARSLPPSEADALVPLAEQIVEIAKSSAHHASAEDELLQWCEESTASSIRSIEAAIRRTLIGEHTLPIGGPNLEMLPAIAATQYVALFRVLRLLGKQFRTTNPTWLKVPRCAEDRLKCEDESLHSLFLGAAKEMADALFARRSLVVQTLSSTTILNRDSATTVVAPGTVDLVLTSPPYCTRIDYVAATRLELAILQPMRESTQARLQRDMLGSTFAPKERLDISADWGETCIRFLEDVRLHGSKASSTYYYRTHLDYFDKLSRSIGNVSACLRPEGGAVFVVQDSYYKELHNDVPKIAAEMCVRKGLRLERREDFSIKRTMAGRHRHVRRYRSAATAVESVLCFSRT
jgi:SAM-dependent methyltransferase